MSELFAVKLVIQPNPIVQQLIEYRWLEGTWFNVTEQKHTGLDTMTHYVMPNIKAVWFGAKLKLSKADWEAVGSPLLLTENELGVIKRTLLIAQKLGGPK
jgi:hypothetical protein